MQLNILMDHASSYHSSMVSASLPISQFLPQFLLVWTVMQSLGLRNTFLPDLFWPMFYHSNRKINQKNLCLVCPNCVSYIPVSYVFVVLVTRLTVMGLQGLIQIILVFFSNGLVGGLRPLWVGPSLCWQSWVLYKGQMSKSWGGNL